MHTACPRTPSYGLARTQAREVSRTGPLLVLRVWGSAELGRRCINASEAPEWDKFLYTVLQFSFALGEAAIFDQFWPSLDLLRSEVKWVHVVHRNWDIRGLLCGLSQLDDIGHMSFEHHRSRNVARLIPSFPPVRRC